jgi:hypothetical protein
MIALLREHGWMAIPVAILLSGATVIATGGMHDHGAAAPKQVIHDGHARTGSNHPSIDVR